MRTQPVASAPLQPSGLAGLSRESGIYEADLQAGPVRFLLTREEFMDAEVTLVVREGETTSVEVTLHPKP